MLGSFLMLYCILTLFGTFLLYRDIDEDGCDPSKSVYDNDPCTNTGPDVFGESRRCCRAVIVHFVDVFCFLIIV